MIVRELLISLGYEIDQKKLDTWQKKASASAKKFADGFDAAFKRVAIGATAATAALATMAIKTAGEFESLRASLKTVTGSASAANVAFEQIRNFAQKTPFSVKEATQAFIKLKSLGLDPSEKALMSYANTASAMGFSLTQFIEAVADASNFEFERLREFGITAKQQGDQVSLTFQGVTTTVRKNSEEITAYLQSIGEQKFGGAAAEQMNTFRGAMSNLRDTFDALLDQIGQAGLLDVIKEIAADLSEMASGANGAAKSFGSALASSIKAAWEQFKRLIPMITRMLEGVPKLIQVGARLAKIFLNLADKIGGPLGVVAVLGALRIAVFAATHPWVALGAAAFAAGAAIAAAMDNASAKAEIGMSLIRAQVRLTDKTVADMQARADKIASNVRKIREEMTGGFDPSLIDESGKRTGDAKKIDRAIDQFIVNEGDQAFKDVYERRRRAQVGAAKKEALFGGVAGKALGAIQDAYNQAEASEFALRARSAKIRELSGKRSVLRSEISSKFLAGFTSFETKDLLAAIGEKTEKPEKPEKTPRARGAGGKKKDARTALQIIEEDFGAGGGGIGAGGHGRPTATLGTTINRINNVYSPTTTVEMDVRQEPGEDSASFAQRVAEIVNDNIKVVVRRGHDHFLGAVT